MKALRQFSQMVILYFSGRLYWERTYYFEELEKHLKNGLQKLVDLSSELYKKQIYYTGLLCKKVLQAYL